MMNGQTHKTFPRVATFVCALGVCLLLALGIWQMERLVWKEKLQAEINRVFADDVTAHALTENDFLDRDKNKMARGHISLNLDMGKAVLMHGKVIDGASAMAVIVPAMSPILSKSIMVEIGCAPTVDINMVRAHHLQKINVTGLVRLPHWSYFTPDNAIDKQMWWRLDAKDFERVFSQTFYDRFLSFENMNDVMVGLRPCPVMHVLNNDHLSYAVFWFTMALVLVAMWGFRFLRPYLQSA